MDESWAGMMDMQLMHLMSGIDMNGPCCVVAMNMNPLDVSIKHVYVVAGRPSYITLYWMHVGLQQPALHACIGHYLQAVFQ